jgi:hypothetical protein
MQNLDALAQRIMLPRGFLAEFEPAVAADIEGGVVDFTRAQAS